MPGLFCIDLKPGTVPLNLYAPRSILMGWGDKDMRSPWCRKLGHVIVACPLVRCKEYGDHCDMQKDCAAVLCYFCGKVGHQKATCPMVKGRKVHLALVVVVYLLQGAVMELLEVLLQRVTTTKEGSGGVSRKVSYTV